MAYSRSIEWFSSLHILQDGDNVDRSSMKKMQSHVLGTLGALYHLLFVDMNDKSNEDSNKCRVGTDFDPLEMKVFFLAVKRIADMGINTTKAFPSHTSKDKYGALQDLTPDSCYLIEEAFPNSRRGDLYGRDWLPLYWSVIVHNDLTRDELREVATKEVLETKTPEKQILGHVLAAAKSPSIDLATLLCSIFPRIFHSKNEFEGFPLHCSAVYSDSVSFVQYVTQQNPSALRTKDCRGRLPIHESAWNISNSRYDIFRTLVEAYPEGMQVVDNDGDTVLHYAIYHYDNPCIDTIKFLIERCPQLCQLQDSKGALPLHAHILKCDSVVTENQMTILRLLVDTYKDGLSVADDDGDFPVHIAVANGCVEIVEYLLEEYPLALKRFGSNNIYPIAVNNNIAITELICSKYPGCLQIPYGWQSEDDDDDNNDLNGFLTLHFALRDKLYAQAKLIWTTYPDAITTQSNNGNLPIHVLCRFGEFDSELGVSTEILRLFVKHHPSGVSVRNSAGDTAYSLLCASHPNDTFLHRIVLRVNPDLDSVAYRRLNYEARRMAIFLLFSAVSMDMEQNVLRQLKSLSMEMVRVVISYL